MSRASVRALVWHHVRSQTGGGLAVGLLAFLIAAISTAAAIGLGLLGDATVRDRLDGLAATQRDVVSSVVGLPQTGAVGNDVSTEDVWGPLLDDLDRVRSDAADPLPDVLSAPHVISRTAPARLAEDPVTRQLSVAVAPDSEEQIVVTEGRLPAAAQPGSVDVEVVLSENTAREMEWAIGDSRTIDGFRGPTRFTLVGLFVAADPGSDYWQHVVSIIDPNIFDDGNLPRVVTGTAFAHPASLAVAYEFSSAQTTQTWFPTIVDDMGAADAAELVAALRRITAAPQAVGSAEGGVGIRSFSYEAPVAAEIEVALAQQNSTLGIVAMLAAGPIGVAVAVLVLGCRLILEGRRQSARLLSARGASLTQLRSLFAAEGILTGLLPGLAGAAIAAAIGVAVFGAAPPPVAFVPALLVAILPLVILMVLAPTVVERRARTDLGRRSRRWRLILEGTTLGLAVIALVLLFIRGYSSGVDPLLAATPLLLALVACLVTLRLYPLPLAAILARSRSAAGLDTFLGSARALREPAIGLTPVLALVVGVSVAVSSGILLSVLQTGVADAARAQIGADLRVMGGLFLDDDLESVQGVDGVEDATGISGASSTQLEVDGRTRGTSVFIVDAAALSRVQGEGPGMLPPGVSLAPVPGEPMPIIASRASAADIADADELSIEGIDARLAGVVEGPVPIGGREKWIAIDQSYAADVLGIDPSDRFLLIAVSPDADPLAVREGVRAVLGPTVRIDVPQDIVAAVERSPATGGLRAALLTATAAAGLLSALAVVMTLTLAARARARTLALLRSLGAPRRSASALALWEIGPPAIAAVLAGSLFGAVVPLVVMAAVDLRPFTGSPAAPAYVLDPVMLALTVGGFVALAGVFTALALLATRRVRATSALRTVEEG